MEEEQRIIRSVVPGEAAGTRLDRYLASRFTYLSRNQWVNMIENGNLLASGRKVRPSHKVVPGEELLFHPPEDRQEPEVDGSYTVLDENEFYIAVNKPPCLPVHPAGIFFRNTLVMLMRETHGVLYPVNRLDRETSGIVLLAKTPHAAKELASLFAFHSMKKEYTAVVHGTFPETLTAEGYLFTDPASVIRKKQKFAYSRPEDADPVSPCKTVFHRIASGDNLSVVQCLPETGHFHQLRATLFSLGFPMTGDKLYGLDETMFLRHSEDALTEEDCGKLILNHQALHAGRLSFASPFTGDAVTLEAPLPEDMQKLCGRTKPISEVLKLAHTSLWNRKTQNSGG